MDKVGSYQTVMNIYARCINHYGSLGRAMVVDDKMFQRDLFSSSQYFKTVCAPAALLNDSRARVRFPQKAQNWNGVVSER